MPSLNKFFGAKLSDLILGKTLATGAAHKQALTVSTGVPALGLGAIASTAYGPEAALMILLPLGISGTQYFFPISLFIIGTLITLYLSYFQTISAYALPNGGGAYIVTSANLGKKAGVWAAVSLLIDYLLNVAVGISAGIGALVSAVPILHPYILELCMFVLIMLTILNLRGIRESGLVFLIPTILFAGCIIVAIVIGTIQLILHSGHPIPVIVPPPFPAATENVGVWLLLGAFVNGLTAMTGIEAVTDSTPIFKKPVIKNAHITLTITVLFLAIILFGLGYLCPSYQIRPMDETQSGYKTLFAQLIAAVVGEGIFYYVAIASIFIVLTYSAQTSFADFPRVCRLLALDDFLPRFFSDQGRRLVYSAGIVILAVLSGLLLIIFKGITFSLIPLFAVGAFSAFLFSQSAMVVHWYRRRNIKSNHIKLFFNGLGAIITGFALIIILMEKFEEGAWIIAVVAPLLVYMCFRIKRHYDLINRQIEFPLKLTALKMKEPIVVVPIRALDRISEKALEFGTLISNEVTAIHVSPIKDDERHPLRALWKEMVEKPCKEQKIYCPNLEIVQTSYRDIYKPILDHIKKIRKVHPNRLIAIVIAELVEPHWYEVLLHNLHGTGLRSSLFQKRDQKIIVINVPWYLREKK